jgi:hypothetical protein
MKAIPKRLPSPATIVACVALVVALGGVSYAAGVLPKDSVGTTQLKKKAVTGAKLQKNAVTGTKIAKDAVTGAKVKDGTLTAAKFKPGQLPTGPQGPKGDPGPQGQKGDKGDSGVTGVANRSSAWTSVPANSYTTAEAQCQAGEFAVGGGFVIPNPAGVFVSTNNAGNVASPTSWRVTFQNTNGAARDVLATVVCAS